MFLLAIPQRLQRQCAAIFQLLTTEDQTLLVWWDALFCPGSWPSRQQQQRPSVQAATIRALGTPHSSAAASSTAGAFSVAACSSAGASSTANSTIADLAARSHFAQLSMELVLDHSVLGVRSLAATTACATRGEPGCACLLLGVPPRSLSAKFSVISFWM